MNRRPKIGCLDSSFTVHHSGPREATVPAHATYDVGAEPIAGYRLVEFLGRGLFGEVWSADDEVAGRVVAVKVLDLTSGGGTVADFRVLARMTALAHPHLVPVFVTKLKDR